MVHFVEEGEQLVAKDGVTHIHHMVVRGGVV
jgi:hypothetical protein